MESVNLQFKQGERTIYYPNSTENMKCKVIKTTSKGNVWEKRITNKIFL